MRRRTKSKLKRKYKRRNPRNPWDGLTVPIEKKVKKLCLNTDLTLEEISGYLSIPLSWVKLSCDKSKIKNRISIRRKKRTRKKKR